MCNKDNKREFDLRYVRVYRINILNTSTREAHKEKNNLLTTLAQTCQTGNTKNNSPYYRADVC